MKKIKTLSQRLESGGFTPPYPLGAEGINIDMMSGCNLEEEFHLGSPNITSFNSEGGIMTITEEYRKEEQENSYYSMVTTFEETENGDAVIVQKLYYHKNEDVFLKKVKKVTFLTSDDNDNFTIKEVVE